MQRRRRRRTSGLRRERLEAQWWRARAKPTGTGHRRRNIDGLARRSRGPRVLGFGDAEDHGSGGYWRGDEERKAAATRGGRRSDGEVVEALVAEVDGEGLGAAGTSLAKQGRSGAPGTTVTERILPERVRGQRDDGVVGAVLQLGADPGVGGRDLAGSRASCRSRRRGGVTWRGAGARSPGRRWRGGEEALGPCSAGSSSPWRCVAARGKETRGSERDEGFGLG